ncbi:hypothetical protein MLGJGCBP_07664 [Rhodococcus sp. T7]|nr:hypothetical protein MLGJGCBP_07664 [Rhodococcus sp. T7]
MDVVHPRCAGVDISKKDAKVCVRIQGRGSRRTSATVTTWGAMTNQILALREHLVEQQVTCVVMEATGNYWKPYFYLLEDSLDVMLVNAHDARNMPGRKSDVSDAAWLADLGAHGLLRGSLVPPPPIRRLRDLTRARTALTRDRARQVQRIEKVLEEPGSNCLRSLPTSWGSPVERCSTPSSTAVTIPPSSRSWPRDGCGRRSRYWPRP